MPRCSSVGVSLTSVVDHTDVAGPSFTPDEANALRDAGVAFIFANFGSDHPGLVEAIAEARAHGRPIPQVITCPNEMVALTAAQGHAQVSGRAQAVVVHVECGTQSLAGAVHNVDKGRVPVLIFAGASPFTQFGEMKGSRNEFIQWIQDVHDQRGIVRGYMRYDAEILLADCTLEVFREIARLEPFGIGNPRPLVRLKAQVRDVRPLGQGGRHLNLRLSDGAAWLEAKCWSKAEAFAHAVAGTQVELVGKAMVNDFNGRVSAEVHVEDLRV